MGAAAGAAGSLLRLLRRLRVGADLSAVWWPHSWYNLRYGLELLPGLALGLGFAAQFCFCRCARIQATRGAIPMGQLRRSRSLRCWSDSMRLQCCASVRWFTWKAQEHCRRIGRMNGDSARSARAAGQRPGGVVLMITSVDPEIVALTGIPLRQTINESDLEIYRDALAAPAAHAALVLAFDGDESTRRCTRILRASPRFAAFPLRPAIGTLYVSDTPGCMNPQQSSQRGGSIAQGNSMSTALSQIAQPFSFSLLEQMVVANGAIGRLLLACVLGGADRPGAGIKRKSAGVRTNLLICMGAAFFTLLSPVLAGDAGNNKGQVASNIVQGIGFLGAGLILHNRSRVSGLASAASIWVVASIGMACGAGLYARQLWEQPSSSVALAVVGFWSRAPA
jgi:hypothetical protein